MSETKANSLIILITGAGSGIGKLTAIELARAGHVVYASMHDLENVSKQYAADIQRVANEEKVQLFPVELDVRYEASCRRAMDRIVAKHKRLDVVMNNAAMMMLGVTEAFLPEQVSQIFDLNAISWLRVNRAALPIMRKQGRGLLIYTGSTITRIPDPFTGPYAASKAAADVLAEVMAMETSQYGIESVIVMPGVYTTGTDHIKHSEPAADDTVSAQYPEMLAIAATLTEKLDAMNDQKRRSDPGEVAEAIRDLIAMPAGTRPRRYIVDPQVRNVERINDLTLELQREVFKRMDVEMLLDVRTAD